MAHIAEYKKGIVEEFVNLIKKYSITAIVNMENMPAPQLQKMRSLIRENIVLRMSKKRLMAIAFDKANEAKKGIDGLKSYLQGMPALMFTNENPFKLYKKLSKNKSEAPAKAGQTAPKDIIVPAGPTSFAPGPVIGELGAVGIKAGIDAGKVVIKQDSTVVKKGDQINQKQAEILTRLGIKPMEIGLDLVAAYEDGTIFEKDILAVDETEFINKLSQANTWAINLSVDIGYPTKGTIEIMVNKAFMDAKALALSENIMADAIAEELLSKAESEMLGLKEVANIEVPEKTSKKEKIVEEDLEKPKEKPIVKEPKKDEKPSEDKSSEQIEKVEQTREEKPVEEIKEEPKKDIPEKITEEKVSEQKVEEVKEQAKPKPEKTGIKEEKKEKPKEVPEEKPKKDVPSEEVNKIVQEIKDHATGKDKVKKEEVSAEKLVEDVKKEEINKLVEVKEEEKPKKIVEEKPKDSISLDVGEIVKKIKDHATGEDTKKIKEISAEKLVEELKNENKQPKKQEKVPTLQELAERKKKNQGHK